MRNVVTGLMMLAGAAVREKGHGFDDFGWRREVQQAREAQESDAATSAAASGDRGEARRAFAGLEAGTARPAGDERMTVAPSDGDDAVTGEWDIACEREAGDRLVFDRASVREMGSGTLFRWAPTGGVAPGADDTIYTAVADCDEKSLEASWPGRRTETRAGTCGRHLVDAVCAARSAATTPKPDQDRLGKPRPRAPHASATP